MSDDITRNVTWCVKTFQRPWACNRLVASILRYYPHARINVADDGKEGDQFATHFPSMAERVNVLTLPFDSGIGAGRNAAVEAAETPFIFLLDDDHIVTPSLKPRLMLDRLRANNIDILGARQGDGGRPTVLTPLLNGKRLWIHKGQRRTRGKIRWCDQCLNAFVARRELFDEIQWDPAFKVFEHWEFFYRVSRLHGKQVAVATDCNVKHRGTGSRKYRRHRKRTQFLRAALRKHGFDSLRWPGGGIVWANK